MENREKYIQIPLIKSIEAIKQIERDEFHDFDVIYFNNINNIYNSKKFYAYKIKNDTMEPRVSKNDIIIFEKRELFSNMDICVIRIANEEAIVRTISKSNGYILLEPLNREYDTTVYKEEDLNKTIKIIGKVISLIRNI